MSLQLAQFVNKTILVCIPSLYNNTQPRPYTLVGVEPGGLWLESEEFVNTLLSSDDKRPVLPTLAAFVSFAQIAYVLDGTHILTPAQKAAGVAVQKELSRQRGEKESDADKPPSVRSAEQRPKRNRKKSPDTASVVLQLTWSYVATVSTNKEGPTLFLDE